MINSICFVTALIVCGIIPTACMFFLGLLYLLGVEFTDLVFFYQCVTVFWFSFSCIQAWCLNDFIVSSLGKSLSKEEKQGIQKAINKQARSLIFAVVLCFVYLYLYGQIGAILIYSLFVGIVSLLLYIAENRSKFLGDRA